MLSSEAAAVDELRGRLGGVLKDLPDHVGGDVVLLRYVRSRDGEVDAAEEQASKDDVGGNDDDVDDDVGDEV